MSREEPMWCAKSHPACTSAKVQVALPQTKRSTPSRYTTVPSQSQDAG